ncbi:MAG: hypothetical protein JO010_01205 [Alphaproteobacteria bacterium]|nr:hypothetical protein [Alphaproteobacteria bacterium]
MIVFEVQKYIGGQWRSYALFDQKSLAADAAKELMRQKVPPAAIRVVQDNGDGSPPRTLFRQSPIDEHNQQVLRQRLELERDVVAMRAQRRAERLQARAAAAAARAQRRRRKGWALLLFRLTLALSASIGLIGLMRAKLVG